MALPKRRQSHARSAKRRTHYKIEMPGMSRCRNCGAMHAPHRACPECGYYKGRLVEAAIRKRKTEEE